LVNSWWNLKTLLENSLLTLKTNVFWPFDETRKVSLWENILTNTEVSWGLIGKWVLWSLSRSLLEWEWGWSYLFRLLNSWLKNKLFIKHFKNVIK
jgi:hypothetical protein